MLGANDFKKRFNVSPYEISLSVERLIQKAKSNPSIYTPFRILLISSSMIHQKTSYDEMFGNRYSDTLELGKYYKDVAKRNNVDFLDLAQCVEPSKEDGLHFDLMSQKIIANVIYDKVNEIL